MSNSHFQSKNGLPNRSSNRWQSGLLLLEHPKDLRLSKAPFLIRRLLLFDRLYMRMTDLSSILRARLRMSRWDGGSVDAQAFDPAV